MKRLRKLFVPLIALLLAFAMIFAVACNDGQTLGKKVYIVTYMANGADYTTQTYEEGDELVLPEEPSLTGYEFQGWNTSADGKGESPVEGSAVNANATYYAIFKAISSENPGENPGNKPDPDPGKNTYTVTFMVNGANYATQTYEEGAALVLPAEPGVEGYEFKGWNTSADGTGSNVAAGSAVNANATYYAIFKAISSDKPDPDPDVPDPVVTYTVTFIANGANYATQTYEKGAKLVLPEEPSLEGYEFKGWNTSADGTGSNVVAGSAVNANATYYAIFKAISSDKPDPDPVVTYTVTFMVDGEVLESRKVNSGTVITPPTAPQKDGMVFAYWYKNKAAGAFDFSQPITSELTLYAEYTALEVGKGIVAAGAYNESIYVVWEDTNPAKAKVEYTLAGKSNWTTVDAPLIRATSSSEARVDILGLAAGSYNVRITNSGGSATQLSAAIQVAAYDRSGYAHFNYTEGVGAYNDDGTLKEGALVIYVTDSNKNNVLDSAYVNGKKVDISQYMKATTATEGVTVGQQTSIGELLNNRRYSGNDRWNVGISKLSEVYGAVAIRIVGVVSAEISGSMDSSIKGLTDYSSTGNGGSKGDNGRMARMVNAHDLTIEGVGEDASIYGWGVHFISSYYSGKTQKMGKGFEVRNITFANYPEDAIGMEGEQGILSSSGSVSGSSSASSDLYSPVERCWIHNNTFLPGYASNPAESDKKEGDGSCDFKRGEYYTLSYNYFEYCHKTNLIGSGDTSLQYNITFHHNWWNQCGSRIPLLRRANIHFYNNYVSGDQTDSKASLSYVTSARANSYMFSENNYFDGCKEIVELASGGVVKSYGDMIYANFKGNAATIVSSRQATVANSCEFSYRKINYSTFDTSSSQFYYKDGKSDCLLDDAVTARINAMKFAGANGHGANVNTAMNNHTPDGAVSVTESGTTITLPTAKGDATVNGVLFKGITGVSSGTIKYKGQGITFTLTAQAQLTVSTTTTGDSAPELVGADGTVYAHKFEGTLTIVLEAGTYFIASGQKDKEVNISSMKFDDTGASRDARLAAAKQAIDALPSKVELTPAHDALIKAARSAYNALTSSEKTLFAQQNPSYLSKLETAENAYSALLIAKVKQLVAAIGTVNANSYDAISAAQTAYDSLTSDQKAQLTSEKATLDAAWTAFAQFEVTNVINLIEAFAQKVAGTNENTDRATIEALLDESETVMAAYNRLATDDEGSANKQAQVTNYSMLTEAIAKLNSINNLYDFLDQLAYFEGHTVTMADASAVAALQTSYKSLTGAQIARLTSTQAKEYERVVAEFEKIMSVTITSDFSNEGKPSDTTGTFTTSGNKKDSAVMVKGVEYKKGLKLDSKGTLTVKVTVKSTLTLYVLNGNYLKLDGAQTEAPVAANEAGTNCYVITLTLEAGTHTITRGGSENSLYYAILAPAA